MTRRAALPRHRQRGLNVAGTALAKERYVSITTFKRDGTPVSTPVWCAGENGTLLVLSAANSWKVKRIRREPHVRIAACSARGKPRGMAIDADATILDETRKVALLLARKYGLAYRAYMLWMNTTRRIRRQRPTLSVTIAITPRNGFDVAEGLSEGLAGRFSDSERARRTSTSR
jgi:uncharacterized protein